MIVVTNLVIKPSDLKYFICNVPDNNTAMPSISRVLYCVSKRGLAFTLPCLSKTESNYVTIQTQLLTENVPCPSSGPGYRLQGIADAYGLSSDESDRVRFGKICDRATQAKRFFFNNKMNGSQVNMFRPDHVHRGLEFGAMLGNPRTWLSAGAGKKADYRYKQTLEILQSKEEHSFHKIYHGRLEEVMELLGLKDLEVGLETHHTADYNTLCSEFYDKLVKEVCGVNVDSGKVINRWRYVKTLLLDKDPINLIRTYFIFKELLDIDLDVSLLHVGLLGRVSALDVLVTMNVFYSLTDPELQEEERKEKVVSLTKFEEMYVESQLMWELSLPQTSQLLSSMGFSKYEINKLIFEIQPFLISDIQKTILDYGGKMDQYIEVMRKRLELLRREGYKLGVADLSGIYRFINNWERVMEAIERADMEKKVNFCFVKFYPKAGSQSPSIKIRSPDEKSRISICRLFLLQYLDITEREQVKEFNKIFRRFPNSRDVPLKVVIDSLQLLESLNFSQAQIKKGFHIALYPRYVLEEEIIRVRSSLGDDWMEKPNALVLLNYFIEVEHGFSFYLIQKGILDHLDHFSKGFSLPEFKELSLGG